MNAPKPAIDLSASFHPRNPYEQFLVHQILWASAQVQSLIAEAPAIPDAKWMKLYSLADRNFHRNVRLFEKSRKTSNQELEIAAELEQTLATDALPVDPAPSAGGLTRRMRYLLSESADPEALLVDWVDRGLLPGIPVDWKLARERSSNGSADASGPPRAVA